MRSAAWLLLLCLITTQIGSSIGRNGNNGSGSLPISNSSVSLNHVSTVLTRLGDFFHPISSYSTYGKPGNISLSINNGSNFSNGGTSNFFYDVPANYSMLSNNYSDFFRGARRRRSTLQEEYDRMEKEIEEREIVQKILDVYARANRTIDDEAKANLTIAIDKAADKKKFFADFTKQRNLAEQEHTAAIEFEAKAKAASEHAEREYNTAKEKWDQLDATRKGKAGEVNDQQKEYNDADQKYKNAKTDSVNKDKEKEKSVKILRAMEKWQTGNTTSKNEAVEKLKKINKDVNAYNDAKQAIDDKRSDAEGKKDVLNQELDAAIIEESEKQKRLDVITKNKIFNKPPKDFWMNEKFAVAISESKTQYEKLKTAYEDLSKPEKTKLKGEVLEAAKKTARGAMEQAESIMNALIELEALKLDETKTVNEVVGNRETWKTTATTELATATGAKRRAETAVRDNMQKITDADAELLDEPLKVLKSASETAEGARAQVEKDGNTAAANIKKLNLDIPGAQTKYDEDNRLAGEAAKFIKTTNDKRLAEERILFDKKGELTKADKAADDKDRDEVQPLLEVKKAKNQEYKEAQLDTKDKDREFDLQKAKILLAEEDSRVADETEKKWEDEVKITDKNMQKSGSEAYQYGETTNKMREKMAPAKLQIEREIEKAEQVVRDRKAREAKEAEDKTTMLGNMGIGFGVVAVLLIIFGAVGATIFIMKRRAAKNKPKRKKKEYETKDGEVRVDILDEDNDKIDKAIIKGKTFDKVGAFDRPRRGHLKDNNTPGIDGIIPYFIGKEKNEAFKCKAHGEDFVDDSETVKDKNVKSVEACDLTDKRNYDRTGDSMKFTEEEEEEERKKKLAAAKKEPLAEITAKSSKRSKKEEKKETKEKKKESTPSSSNMSSSNDMAPDNKKK